MFLVTKKKNESNSILNIKSRLIMNVVLDMANVMAVVWYLMLSCLFSGLGLYSKQFKTQVSKLPVSQPVFLW